MFATTRSARLATALVVCSAWPILAQTGSAPEMGARIRVSVGTNGNFRGQTVGTLLELRGDSLVLLQEGATRTISLSLDEVTRVQVSRGTKSKVFDGMFAGLLLGVPVGAFVTGPGLAPHCSGSGLLCDLSGVRLLASLRNGGVKGAVAGLAVGGAIGALLSKEAWASIPFRTEFLAALQPSITGGLGVSMGVRF